LISVIVLMSVVVVIGFIVFLWIYGLSNVYPGYIEKFDYSDPRLIVISGNNTVIFSVSMRNSGTINISFTKIFVKEVFSCLSKDLSNVFGDGNVLRPGERKDLVVVFENCSLSPGVGYTISLISLSGRAYYIYVVAEEK